MSYGKGKEEMNSPNDEMTSGEAADYLGVSRQRIAQLTTARLLTPRRVGKFWLYRRGELDQRKAENPQGGRPKEEAEPSARVALA